GRQSGTRPDGLLEVFGDTSESEASTFHGFEEAELERLQSDDDSGPS
ncbi:zinc finger protein DPF3-like isoform X3, partial [Tachysurus ichikawai]